MVLNITHSLIQVLLLLIGFKCHEAEAKPIGTNSIGLTNFPDNFVLNVFTDLGTMLKQRYKNQLTSEKRGIDFGLGRGYSGSQAARHMLGLQQVSYAGGPGRKKRSGFKKTMLIVPIEQ